MKKCIILANGQAPTKNVFRYLDSKGYSTLICADGGANSSAKLNLIPDYIIGDLDSINPDVYDYYFDRSKIIHIKRQNDTDVEKCLKYALKKNYRDVFLLGATGDRLDHSFCNIGIVMKYFNILKIQIIHQKSLLSAYSGSCVLKTVPNEIISIYGVDNKTRVTSYGLKYELKNTTLPFGVKESTSNEALGEEVRLGIRGGIMLVIRDFKTMSKNDLF